MRSYDVVVVGSGFGGAVAALRLTEKGYRVAVLEEGRRFEPQDFPRTSWHVRDYLWAPRLGCRGIQRITPLRDVLVLSGAGVGGGSLVYANTLYEPPASVWSDPEWADELAPWYEQARRMLGVTRFRGDTPADGVMRAVAERLGVADTFEPTPVGVWFGDGRRRPVLRRRRPAPERLRPARRMHDRLPPRRQELARPQLPLARRARRRRDLPETRAELLRASDDSSLSWVVETSRGTFRAREVVLAAGVLGTVAAPLRSGLGGPHVGDDVRTNSEVIVGASARARRRRLFARRRDHSMIRADEHTQIQAVRYGKGSNLMGLLGTILVDEAGPVRWLAAALGTRSRSPAARGCDAGRSGR